MTLDKIFIIPFRDREQHKHFFSTYIQHILEDEDPSSYKIYYAHQKDTRPFNRGAMKNIGFMAMKQKYPTEYKEITFIFNDIDVVPYKKGVFSYNTAKGKVIHNYGYTSCLGGCFAIKGSDFEKTNGFPNIWAWGLEDFVMQKRVLESGIHIDRSSFRPIGHKDVLQLYDGVHRTLLKESQSKTLIEHKVDGVQTIQGLEYTINNNMIDITKFATFHKPTDDVFTKHVGDLGINATRKSNRSKQNFLM
jgi:hypothetical protein